MRTKSSAFTLIELSAVIAIIGILIAGVMTATSLVKKSKIAAAQSLTKASPIAGIQDNALWLESSSEASFKDSETSTGDLVTTWYDQKNSVDKSSVVAVGTGPTYSNTINYIHAVKFSGSTANYLQISDASFLNNTDYTIVVLEKRQNATAGYFIGDSTVSTANQTLLLGYSADAAISHSQGTGNAYASNISTYSSSTDTPRIFTFVSDSVNGKKTYINGILAAQSSDTTKLSNITTLAIGKGYTGEIGEIAIFTRALKADERKTTEDYLGKKYSAKVNRTTSASGSCLNGIVTNNGCSMDCSTSSIVGLSSPSTVADGASGVTGTCGATGYSGTVSLSCPGGTGVISPATCGCASGYLSSGGVCISNCSYTLTGGSPTTGTVSAGSGTLSCNTASHYAATYSYTCSGGAPITATCACATGYTGAGCSICDTGYVSGGGGTCVLPCTIPAGSGTTLTLVAPGTTSTTCDSAGFAGTLAYTCSTGGVPITVTTACVQVCTSTGGVTADTTTVPGSTIFKFINPGTYTFTCPTAKTPQVLVVGGGGSGGLGRGTLGGGGGGGGGVVYSSSYPVAANTPYPVTVGAGGNAPSTSQTNGSNGADSVFGTMTALGGGGGGADSQTGSTYFGRSGGSGGGSSGSGGGSLVGYGAASQTNQTNATSFYGNRGGLLLNTNDPYPGAGGGGAGGTGSSPAGNVGGVGGSGVTSTITSGTSFSAFFFGAGGAGGSGYSGTTSFALGGNSYGGRGAAPLATTPYYTAAAPGIANSGGGGGGACCNSISSSQGSGGSGIVIVRY